MEGKVALVTGGARGQGEAEARLLVERGAKVVIGDVLEAEGEALAEELGEAVTFVPLDVTSSEQWATAVDVAVETYGALTTLVNNAGIVRTGTIETLSEEDWGAVVAVNQTGCFLGMQAAAPALKAAGRAAGASIVNVSSVAGFKGVPGCVAYVATKWAIRGMTRVAALELGPAGIRVNAVCPGTIDTPMVASPEFDAVDKDAIFGSLPVPRIGEPVDVAELVAFLASDAASYCSGSEYAVDGGSLAGDPLEIS